MCIYRRYTVFLICSAALGVLAVGCTSEPAKNRVGGKLTKGGVALQFDPIFGRVEMAFVPMKGNARPPVSAIPEEAEQAEANEAPAPPGVNPDKREEEIEVFYAQVLPSGEYFVDGGIPDGRYLITVRHYPKKDPDTPLDRQDALKGAFSIRNSPIIREIKGSMNLDIDLAKPNG